MKWQTVVSLLVAIAFLVAFIWAVKNGQFEDTYTPSVRILWDEEKQQKQIREK